MDKLTVKRLDEITYEVVGAAIEVHKIMGRGLLESVYQQCMIEEIALRNLNFIRIQNSNGL
jgi:GxxExxY protein